MKIRYRQNLKFKCVSCPNDMIATSANRRKYCDDCREIRKVTNSKQYNAEYWIKNKERIKLKRNGL